MSSAHARILLVEDNPADRQFMNACLQVGGCELELDYASRLEEASSRLKRQHYEMVIADLNLPDAEGLDTFYKVKELANDAAIVVMTGMDDAKLASRAVFAGAQDYLVKGNMEPKRVWQTLSNALSRHDQMRRISNVAHDLRKKNSSLRELAYVDPLTGMLNRRGLAKALGQMQAQRFGMTSTHALLVDVDDFKNVNDLFGHSGGDQALKDIGRRIRLLLRSNDVGARVGGDEFLLLASAADSSAAVSLGERIRTSISDASLGLSGAPFRVTVSVGVVALGKGPYDIEDLLDAAEDALKASKGGGKNRVCLHGEPTPAPGPGAPGVAVIRNAFFEVSSGLLGGYLLQGPVETGLVDAGSISMDQVKDLLRAASMVDEGLECHLDLSHIQLLQLRPEDLAGFQGLDRQRLRLSIREVPISPPPVGMLAAVQRLQSAGWSLALRGLGFGAHSWSNLILLEPAVVTLDPGLLSGAPTDLARQRGLRRLCRALDSLGTLVIADGVEGAQQLKLLNELGIRFASGTFLKEDRR